MKTRFWRKHWTPEARQAARERALAHPEWNEKGRIAFAAKYPDRVTAYAEAMEHPQPCDTCDGAGRPFFTLKPYALAGWRCYECRIDRPPHAVGT